ncbi:MAG: tetratricopeptide repeat protein [Flavobacteriales bacterium]
MDFVMQQRAKSLLDLQRPQQALRLLAEMLAKDPEDHYAHYLTGYAHLSLHNLAQALASAERAVGLSPERAAYLILLANLSSLNGEHDRGLSIIDDALRNSPEDSTAFATMGAIHLRSNRFEQAETALSRAIELDPGNLIALQLGSVSADAVREGRKAGERIADALRQDAGNARSLASLAWHNFLIGGPGDHKAAFRHALAQDPFDALARTGLLLNLSWFPRYQAFAQRMTLRALHRGLTWDMAIRISFLLLFILMTYFWIESGFRRDIGLVGLVIAFIFPNIPLVALPALLQTPVLFSEKRRTLLSRMGRFRLALSIVFYLSAIISFGIGLMLTPPQVLISMVLLVSGLLTTSFNPEKLKPASILPISMMVIGGIALIAAVIPPFSEGWDLAGVFGLVLLMSGFMLVIEHRDR